MEEQRPLCECAYHEAGHVVLYLIKGIRVRFAQAVYEHWWDGKPDCPVVIPVPCQTLLTQNEQNLNSMGGLVAQEMFGKAYGDFDSNEDVQMLVRQCITSENIRGYMCWARGYLADRRDAVDRIAKYLINVKKVGSPQSGDVTCGLLTIAGLVWPDDIVKAAVSD